MPRVDLRATTALVILGIFFAGAATGAGAYHLFRPRPPHHRPPPMALPLDELDLTAEQDVQAHQILDRHRDELEVVLRETYPRVRAVNDEVENDLRTILTPAQQHKLDEIIAHRPPRGGPGGPFSPDPGSSRSRSSSRLPRSPRWPMVIARTPRPPRR